MLLKEISHDALWGAIEYLNDHAEPADYPFNYMFENNWRVAIPLDIDINKIVRALVAGTGRGSGISPYLPLAYLYELVNGEGHIVDFAAGKIVETVTETNPETGESKRRNVEYKIGKWIQRRIAILNREQLYMYEDKVRRLSEVLDFWNRSSEQIRSGFTIILSQHPIDVMRMSDFKAIQSCHTQGGEYFECVLQEAQGHGPIAYLLSNAEFNKIKDRLQDREIFEDKGFSRKGGTAIPGRDVSGAKPVSRIRLRELYNAKFGSLLVPEMRIYGTGIADFRVQLNDWLHAKQDPHIASFVKDGYLPNKQSWNIVGGEYHDTNAGTLLEEYFGYGNFYDIKDYDYNDVTVKIENFNQEQRPEGKYNLITTEDTDQSSEYYVRFLQESTFKERILLPEGYTIVGQPDLYDLYDCRTSYGEGRSMTIYGVEAIDDGTAEGFEVRYRFARPLRDSLRIKKTADIKESLRGFQMVVNNHKASTNLRSLTDHLISAYARRALSAEMRSVIEKLQQIPFEHGDYDENKRVFSFVANDFFSATLRFDQFPKSWQAIIRNNMAKYNDRSTQGDYYTNNDEYDQRPLKNAHLAGGYPTMSVSRVGRTSAYDFSSFLFDRSVHDHELSFEKTDAKSKIFKKLYTSFLKRFSDQADFGIDAQSRVDTTLVPTATMTNLRTTLYDLTVMFDLGKLQDAAELRGALTLLQLFDESFAEFTEIFGELLRRYVLNAIATEPSLFMDYVLDRLPVNYETKKAIMQDIGALPVAHRTL